MKFADRIMMIDDLAKLTDFGELKTKVMFSDDFKDLNKERQLEIYTYCKANANNEVCRENLKQIRYAVSELYFGW